MNILCFSPNNVITCDISPPIRLSDQHLLMYNFHYRPEAEWVRGHGSSLGNVSRELQKTPLQVRFKTIFI